MDRHEFRAWRKQRDLTQGQLAVLLGVKWLAVSRWERGERGIPALLPLALKGLEIELGREGK